jgi:hypothetical protein
MKIKETKNLKYDKIPWLGIDEGYEKFEAADCLLEDFERTNDKLSLHFKNGSLAVIRAINIEGGKEIDLIDNKLNEFLGKSYREILEFDF